MRQLLAQNGTVKLSNYCGLPSRKLKWSMVLYFY